MALIDIIIPVYRTPIHWVEQTLVSVKAQKFDDWKVLVIDDGSGVKYQSHIQQTAESVDSDRIIVINYENSAGPAHARNMGINTSSSRYVAFLDADDLWLPDKLANQISIFESNPDYSLVCGNMSTIDDDGYLMSRRSNDPSSIFNNLTQEERIISLLRKNWVKTLTVMVTRESLDHVGLFDESLQSCTDWDLWLRYAINKELIHYEDIVWAKYRKHLASISHNYELVLQSRVAVVKKAIERIKRNYHGLVKKDLEEWLLRKAHLSIASKLYHSGQFMEAAIVARDSLRHGYTWAGLKRFVKSRIRAEIPLI